METRVTPWVAVAGLPVWAGTGISAYRIWQRLDGRHLEQRHEWRMLDGTVSIDPWVESIGGWCPRSVAIIGEVA